MECGDDGLGIDMQREALHNEELAAHHVRVSGGEPAVEEEPGLRELVPLDADAERHGAVAHLLGSEAA
eukprot:11295046-Alexandrium_andersonii.AAC.1